MKYGGRAAAIRHRIGPARSNLCEKRPLLGGDGSVAQRQRTRFLTDEMGVRIPPVPLASTDFRALCTDSRETCDLDAISASADGHVL